MESYDNKRRKLPKIRFFINLSQFFYELIFVLLSKNLENIVNIL